MNKADRNSITHIADRVDAFAAELEVLAQSSLSESEVADVQAAMSALSDGTTALRSAAGRKDAPES